LKHKDLYGEFMQAYPELQFLIHGC
jgi:hypothetical protein